MFTDADAAALYDVLNPWDGTRYPSDAFYHDLVMKSPDVLDVGCGTGQMLHQARGEGHRGRLVGLDPDRAALARAKTRTDIEWVTATAADAGWNQEFDLATMVSHAFQCLITDTEIQESLEAIRRALRKTGMFAFETMHPQHKPWESWTDATEVTLEGQPLRVSYEVNDVTADVVTVTETTTTLDGVVQRQDRAQLRFLDVPKLNAALQQAGFTIEAQYGDWHKNPVSHTSTEIITLARP